jgi:hypothetical protein
MKQLAAHCLKSVAHVRDAYAGREAEKEQAAKVYGDHGVYANDEHLMPMSPCVLRCPDALDTLADDSSWRQARPQDWPSSMWCHVHNCTVT